MEVVLGTGRSPARPQTWGLDYVLARREASSAGPSRFLTVLEPYQGSPLIRSVRLVSSEPPMLEVDRGDLVDEITLSAPGGTSRTYDHRPLGVRVRTRRGDLWERNIRIGEYGVADHPGYANGTVSAVEYDSKRIGVTCPIEAAQELQVGRYVRVHNEHRSGMFRIVQATRDGGTSWLTLDSPALLSQGPVVKTANGTLWIEAFLDWSRSSTDKEGQLVPEAGGDYFVGAWIGEGGKARQLRGATRGLPSRLFLAQDVPAKTLQADYGGTVLSIWQYGVGDRVEVPRVRE